MAKGNEHSMHSYVIRQNTAGAFDGPDDPKGIDISDLKVAVPGAGKGGRKKSASANTQTARSNGHPSGARGTRASARRDSAPQQPQQNVYGTDASAADQMSAVENMDPARQVKTKAQLSGSQPKTRNGAGSGEHDSGDGEGGFEDEQNLNAHSGNLRHNEMSESIVLRRVSGDTYPDTTSGSPSTVDQNGFPDRHGTTQGPRQGYQHAASGIRSRGAGSRAVLPTAEPVQTQQLQQQISGQGQLPPPGLYGQPGPLPHSEIQGFAYGLAKPSLPNMSRTGQQPQQTRTQQIEQHQTTLQPPNHLPKPQHQHDLQPARPHSQHAKRSAPTDQAQHGSDVPPDQQLRLLKEQEQQKHAQGHDRRETRSPHDFAPPHVSSKQRADRAMNPLRPETEIPSMQDQQYSDDPDRGFNGYASGNGHEEEYAAEDDNRLDYEPDQLFNMDYHTLKSHPFDSDPNAEPFALPNQEQAETLEQKLQIVARFEPQTQANFFQSLNLDQWEEAGDWFLARFGELAGQFKDARKAKRKAAREFEDEVEQRHEAVARKRKLTQVALDEMKESGGKVLQGTPKKGKKAR